MLPHSPCQPSAPRVIWRCCRLQVTLTKEGVPGLYRGLAPHVLRVMPQSAITFLVYEQVLRALHSVAPPAAAPQLSQEW